MNELTVQMPLELDGYLIRAVRDNPLTSFDDKEQWHERLGWLICAYEVLIEARRETLRNDLRRP